MNFEVLPDKPSPERMTHTEGIGDGGCVIVQHCEHKDPETELYCNYYLGVNYPSLYCKEHQKEKR